MKLEDCKPGVCVAVYSAGARQIAVISHVHENGNQIKVYFTCGRICAYPQQLRKIVNNKRPEMMYAFHPDGTWSHRVPGDLDLEEVKKSGKTVWLMCGIRRL